MEPKLNPAEIAAFASLFEAIDARSDADAKILLLVVRLRELDTPWSIIGEALGVSRQAAQQRYGAHEPRRIMMKFGCRHSLSVEVNRIISVGSTVRCGQCGKSTKVVGHVPS